MLATSVNMIWFVGFAVLLLALHLIYPIIFRYIDDKPPGRQSIFDLVFKDHFMISRYNGTIYCLVSMISRLDCLKSLIDDNDIVAIVLSTVYDFSFALGTNVIKL